MVERVSAKTTLANDASSMEGQVGADMIWDWF